jgi:hypothetical protein
MKNTLAIPKRSLFYQKMSLVICMMHEEVAAKWQRANVKEAIPNNVHKKLFLMFHL